MVRPPVGTLTFLMTDIEGSTRMWEESPQEMGAALLRHEAIVQKAVESFGGHLILEQGEGDSTFSVFKDATYAALAAQTICRLLETEEWPAAIVVRIRAGLHSGVADMRQDTYYGRAVNRAARVRSVGHGGQVLLTRATRELLDPKVFPTLKDHGLHRLKDLLQPEHLFELPSDEPFPPLRSLNQRPNNLPVQLTSFIARETDQKAIMEALGRGRLLTLVGPGGSGKTRLALQVGADTVDQYPGGVFFVELIAAASEEDAIALVLHAAGVDGFDDLAESQALIILDNSEHLIHETAAIAKRILLSCPNVRVLVTSRQPLQLRSELIVRIGSLSLPSESDLANRDRVLESEAVQLFADRAAAKVPGFAVTDANCGAIGKLCRRLDGIALAIELAAPKLKLLTPEQLLVRLNDRFKILRDGDRTESERHQTLRATIDHSYDLLNDEERRLFQTLSVFRNGWTLEAAEAVGSSVTDDVLGLLESLYDKSLIHSGESATGIPRSMLLESLREYAAEKLRGSGAGPEANLRLSRWLTDFAALQEHLITAHGEEAALPIDLELPNINAALEWCQSMDQTRLGLDLCREVWHQWRRRGLFTEGRRWLRAFLADDSIDAESRAHGYSIAGTFAWYQNDLEEAGQCFQASLTLYEEANNEVFSLGARNNLGLLAANQHDFEAARSYFLVAMQGFETLGDHQKASSAAVNLGTIELDLGHYEEADARFEQALANWRTGGRSSEFTILYCNLVEARLLHRGADAAIPLLADCAQAFQTGTRERPVVAQFLLLTMHIASQKGYATEAATIEGAELALRRDMEMVLRACEQDLLDQAQDSISGLLTDHDAKGARRMGAGMDSETAFRYAADVAMRLAASHQPDSSHR